MSDNKRGYIPATTVTVVFSFLPRMSDNRGNTMHTIDAEGMRVHYNSDFSGDCKIQSGDERAIQSSNDYTTVTGSSLIALIEEAIFGDSYFAECVRAAIANRVEMQLHNQAAADAANEV